MSTENDIVSVELTNGSIVRVRATVIGDYEDVAAFDKVLSFKGVTDTIEGIASSLAETLKKVKPDKASIEFGLEIGVESGELTTLVVQGTGTTNLKITLEWGK